MIALHRLGHPDEPFHLNPDLISTVEGHPDTVVSLTTGVKVVVAETPDEVIGEIRAWRVEILSDALRRRRSGGAGNPRLGGSRASLSSVEGSMPNADQPG